jgi:hypothetical protein
MYIFKNPTYIYKRNNINAFNRWRKKSIIFLLELLGLFWKEPFSSPQSRVFNSPALPWTTLVYRGNTKVTLE